LHREATGKPEEKQAEEFAGAFLVPRADVLALKPHLLSLEEAKRLKRRWGISLAALVYRFREIGVISDWQFRVLFIELSKRGYRTKEPNPAPRLPSALLPQVFSSLRERSIRPGNIAADLCWMPRVLNELIFSVGGSLTAMDGEKGR
jgi:Zn-dependent peptidase ImmA (M78 family)